MTLGSRDSAISLTLSRGTSIGLAIDTEVGLISIIAASVVLFLISRKLWMTQRFGGLDILVINLFFFEILQGIGHALEMKWAIEGTVRTGLFCSVQGAFQQLGELGVALATLAIAIFCFLSVWRVNAPCSWTAFWMVVGQFIFVLLFVSIGFGVNTHPPTKYYAAPSPYWCWIGDGFLAEKIAGEYVWFWVTLGVSFVLYIPMFLWYLGCFDDSQGWYAPGRPRPGYPGVHANQGANEENEISENMWATVLYPFVYCILILPLSVVRFMDFTQKHRHGESHIRPIDTFAVGIIFTHSGVVNALLYLTTRGMIFFPPREYDGNV